MRLLQVAQPARTRSVGGFFHGRSEMAYPGSLTSNAKNTMAGVIGNAGLNSPRPLGFVERAVGLAAGLDQLKDRLQSVLNRIDGNGDEIGGKTTSAMPGLGSQLSEAESHLRDCHSLIDELHARF
jgi:hypothetical protein